MAACHARSVSVADVKEEAQDHLENSRNEVLQAVSELSEIVQGNVDSTKKTYDETEEVVDISSRCISVQSATQDRR